LPEHGRDVRAGRPARLLLAASLAGALLPAARAQDYADELAARALSLGLAEDAQWLALGHYERHLLGGRVSHAAGGKFFLAPDGSRDPAAELAADLRGFFAPADLGKDHPQCRFPARYAWLKGRLAFDPARLPEQPCTTFHNWLKTLDASGATLVFADAYLNNPGSMYGHTFLRLRRGTEKPGEALLDYTINFAGNPDTDNGFLYAVKGVLGAFPGQYSALPYYLKTQEYTNLESRDLWEYDLALDQRQTDRLLQHAWELGSAYFPYYFFDENCSYQLLTLLDAAEPSLRLARDFPAWVIPGDTVRAVLRRPGLVSAARYRPSFVTQMLAKRARLSSGELRLATGLGREGGAGGLGALEGLPKERQALILDSADDYLRYRVGFTSEQSTWTLRSERALLIARGRLGLGPLPAEVPRPRPLEDGHNPPRLDLGYGSGGHGPFEELGWRPALQDLPASDVGYPRDSQLEFFDARLRFGDRDRRAYVEKLDLINVMSLSPLDPWVVKPSWKVSTGVDQARELGCEGPSCMYYDLDGGGGLAAQTRLLGREVYYLLGEADAGAGPVFRQGWKAGAGVTAGLLLQPASFWRVMTEGTYIGYVDGPARERLRLTSSLRLSRDAELRVVLDRWVPDREAGAYFNLYY